MGILGRQMNQRGSPSALARPMESVERKNNKSKNTKSQAWVWKHMQTKENPDHITPIIRFHCCHILSHHSWTFHICRFVFYAFHPFNWPGQPEPTEESARLYNYWISISVWPTTHIMNCVSQRSQTSQCVSQRFQTYQTVGIGKRPSHICIYI